MFRKVLTSTSIAMILAMISPAHAIGLKDLKSPLGGDSDSAGSAEASQEKIVQSYTEARTLVLGAQAELQEALGLKDEAAESRAHAEALGSGSVDGKKGLQEASGRSADADASIQEKFDAGGAISDEGREHYINGLALYIQGLVATKDMAGETADFGKQAQAELTSASMMQKGKLTKKLAAGTFLVSEIPSFTSRLAGNLQKLTAFAKSAGIPVPDDATDALAAIQ